MSRFLILLFVFLYVSTVEGQDFFCGFGLYSESTETQSVRSATQSGNDHQSYQSGTVRPLFLFGQFNVPSNPFGVSSINADKLLDPNHKGSLAHYFKEMSYNTLMLGSVPIDQGGSNIETWYKSDSADVLDYIQLPTGACKDIDNATEKLMVWQTALKGFVTEVIENADSSIDFSRYDTDNDGNVDLVGVFNPREFGEECGPNGTVLTFDPPIMTKDNVPNTNSKVSISKVITSDQREDLSFLVSVMAHEYGHVMGLPELFDRDHLDDSSTNDEHGAGIGIWGIMGRGSTVRGPMSVWSRVEVGWVSPVVVGANMSDIVIHDITSSPSSAYKIPISDKEYFLVSNRQNTYSETGGETGIGSYYDDDSPVSGLAIWHIDEKAVSGKDANKYERYKRVDLECADGLFTDQGYPSTMPNSVIGGDNLDYWHDGNPQQFNGNAGDATDLWDGSSYSAFSPYTNPSTAGYEAGGGPLTKRQNVFSGIYIENISKVAGRTGVMMFDVLFAPLAPNSLEAAVGENQVELSWEPPSGNGATVGSYKVRYRPSNSTSELDWMDEPLLGNSARGHTVTELTDQKYTFEVLAISDNDKEGAAASIEATPQIDIAGPVEIDFDENSDKMVGKYEKSGSFNWSLEGIDEAKFELRGMGGSRELWFMDPPNYEESQDKPDEYGDGEKNNIYHVTVKATPVDPGRQVFRYMKEVAVRVVNVDEQGTVTIFSDGREVSDANRPQEGTELTATLTDLDGVVSIESWTWSRAIVGTSGMYFNPIEGAMSPAYTPVDADVGIRLEVKVNYTDGEGSGKEIPKTVDVLVPPGEPRELVAEAGASQVTLMWKKPLNTGSDHITLTTYEYQQSNNGGATWPAGGEEMEVTCRGDDCSLVITDLADGEYAFRVRAVNKAGSSDWVRTAPISIRSFAIVGDSALEFAEVVSGETRSLELETYTVTGGASATWSLEGVDKDAFTLMEGVLSFATPPDYENPTDDGDDNIYHVTVRALSEGEIIRVGPSEVTKEVTVEVTNVEEAGMVTLSPLPPQVGRFLNAELTDADGIQGVPQWQWQRRANGSSTWTDIATRSSSSDASTARNPLLSSYRPVADDEDHQLQAIVSYDDGHDSGKTAESDPTDPVVLPPLAIGGDFELKFVEVVSGETRSLVLETYTVTGAGGASVAWSLGGVDKDAFTLGASDGMLSFKMAPDYENPMDYSPNNMPDNIYTIDVVATAGGQTATLAVEVEITNADDPGMVTLSSTQPEVGEPITATLTDQDGSVENVRWSWLHFSSEDGPRNGEPTVVSSSDELIPSGVLMGLRLQARALYADEFGTHQSAESVQTEPVVGRPSAPQNLTATPSEGSLVLAWDAPSLAGYPAFSGYRYRYKATKGTGWLPSAAGALVDQTTRPTLEELTHGKEYTVEVWAVNAQGAGPAATTTATPPSPDTPGRVELTSMRPRVGVPLTATLVDPDAPVQVRRWRWQQSPWYYRSAGDSSLVAPSEARYPELASYEPTVPAIGRRLRAVVDYTDQYGTQSAQSAWTAPVLPGRPEAPALSATAGDAQVALTWTAAADQGRGDYSLSVSSQR